MNKALAGSLVMMAASIPALAAAQTVSPIAGTRLEVGARGEVERAPDVALIEAGVVTQASDAASAMAQNAARIAQILGVLGKAGIAMRDIRTSAVSLSPQYRYADNQPPVITGYQASNMLNIKFRDIARSGAILDLLVKQGANQISGPNLMLDDPAAAQDEARIVAIKRARARADLYAHAAGLKVRRIVSIVENEANGAVPMMMETMARAEMSTAKTVIMPGLQTMNVNVTVVFELE